ncbi:site-2 protease family protein [Natronorubrum aibiense]|uniref:Zinc metalloprotease n=1 Tax=Natronorubrum aibiense TaxID=348826 RepID=A0A5P9NZ50_9EURY|nr:site-2 protease family protein [Natronorubrum aibiense]QFU81164.1 CBS domain-containing protein [Natronorubrum aibiense]
MRNYRIANIWGIPIQLNISLLIFLPVLVWLIAATGQIEVYASIIDGLSSAPLDAEGLQEGLNPWLIGTAAAVGLFFSVAVHELGHAYAARRYGIGIRSITLWIFGGLASLESMPREWDREFWIAIAGPVTSVLLAGVFFGALQVVPASLPLVVFVVGWLAVINVTLAIFNMLPAFPMDGGRILRALLARSRSYASATRTAARVGTIFALLFAIIGVLSWNPVLILIAFFVYGTATTESRTTMLDELLTGVTARDVMDTTVRSVSADTSVADFTDRLLRDRQTEFVVVDSTDDVVGFVTLSALKRIDRDIYETTSVREVMETDVPAVEPSTPAFDVLVAMRNGPLVLVVEGDEQIGTVSRRDLGRVMDLRKQLGAGQPFERVAM